MNDHRPPHTLNDPPRVRWDDDGPDESSILGSILIGLVGAVIALWLLGIVG